MDPAEIHRMEQAGAGARNLAVLVRRYFDALVEEGFTEPQAIYLAEAWQRDVIQRARGDG